jgi:hypothetical protein
MKKDGELIRNRQIHHLILPDIEGLIKEFLAIFPGVLLNPGPMKFSGTVMVFFLNHCGYTFSKV